MCNYKKVFEFFYLIAPGESTVCLLYDYNDLFDMKTYVMTLYISNWTGYDQLKTRNLDTYLSILSYFLRLLIENTEYTKGKYECHNYHKYEILEVSWNKKINMKVMQRKVLDVTKCIVCQMNDSKEKVSYILFPIMFFLGNM